MEEKKKKSVTIKLIAKELGISVSSVCKAMNNYPDIGEATKNLVIEKALELGYSHSNYSRNVLYGRTSNSIGILVRDISAIYGEIFKPLAIEANKKNLNLIISDSNRIIETENRCLFSLIDSKIKGLIIAPINSDYQRIEDIINSRIPVVYLGNSVVDSKVNYVGTDVRKGTELALEYLYNLGHRKIALIGGNSQMNSSKVKIEAYQEFMRKHNLLPAVFSGNSTTHSLYETGYEQAKGMLSVSKDFTAVYVVRDAIAIGAMRAFKDMGIKVPEDISIIGHDGSSIAGNPLVELTTVSQPLDLIVRELIRIIVSQSENTGTKTREHYLAEPFIEERSSCCPPREK